MKNTAEGGNPLAELGIAPELVRRLTDDQLGSVAGALVKELLLQFHSDTGQTASTDNYTWALKIRKDLAQRPIKQLRKELIDPKRTRDTRQKKAVQLQTAFDGLAVQAWEYMQAVAGLSPDSLNNLHGRTLNLADTIGLDHSQAGRFPVNVSRFFFALEIETGGSFARVRGKERQRTGRKLLGCVARTKLSAGGILALMPRESITKALSHGGRKSPRPTALNGKFDERSSVPTSSIPLGQATNLLRLLSPVVCRESYLFSLGEKDGAQHLFLEGMVTKV